MWTDAFQSVVMLGSFLAILIKGNYDAGGAQNVFEQNYETGRMQFFK